MVEVSKSIDELYTEAAKIQEGIKALMDDGVTNDGEDKYLELVEKRFELAKLKRDIALKELQNSDEDEEVKKINKKIIELEYEKDQNYYEEGKYRWALSKMEKALTSPLSFNVPESLIEKLNEILNKEVEKTGINLTLNLDAKNTNNMAIVKAAMLKKGIRIVEIGEEKAAQKIKLENHRGFSNSKVR